MVPFHLTCMLLTLSVTIFAELSVTSASLTHYDHKVNVQGGEKDCTDLSEPLTEVSKYNKSVLLQLGKGCFNLNSSGLAVFTRWTDFAIIGSGKDFSILNCGEGVGFTFLSSVGITLRSLKIVGCGREQTSTSKNFTLTKESGRMSYLHFFVGMYFLSCGDVTMENVEVRESRGVGVVMYNCNGTNIFNYTNFTINFMDNDRLYRSGGMAVEFTFCQPDDTRCKDSETSSIQVTQSRYTFFQCHFGENGDDTFDFNGDVVGYPHGTDHVAFGKGGGLSVIFKGRSSENSITIDNCTFKANSAQWGGGLYTSFGDQSIDNKITVTRSKFFFNQNLCEGNSPKWMKSGGGAQIDFIYYPADDDVWPGYQPNVLRNSVNFYDTDFATNMACWGGAVSIIVSRESPGHSPTNSILFDNCHFKYNQASIAAAVDVSIFQPDLIASNGTLMKPVFKNCDFVQNGITYTDATNRQLATGSLYINLVPVTFVGETTFSGNEGTALVVSGTYVSLAESSKLMFDSNIGRHGGALAFIGNSWLIVHKSAYISFRNNSADTLGGAVYSVHFGEHDLVYKQNCFFQYYKATLPPSRWNATFNFTMNTVRGKPNSIYTTSLLPCVWPSSGGTLTPSQTQDTFCSLPFVFERNTSCSEEISTAPSNLYLTSTSIKAIPGWEVKLPVTAYNDFGHVTQSVYTAVPYGVKDNEVIQVSNSTEYIADNHIVVRGVTNTSANLLLRTLDPRVISSQLQVDIQDCPPGYSRVKYSDNQEMVYNCICNYSFYGVGCNNESHYIKVYRYNCLTSDPKTGELVSGRCPYNLNDTIFNTFDEFSNDEMCKQLNRKGVMCSKCINGTGVNVNSYNFPCGKCDAHYSWVFYIIAEIVPIVIFFIIVAFFNISATSAPMNAFVFFSQIVTVPYFHNPYTFVFGVLQHSQHKVLESFITIFYGIWNLDISSTALIPGFCLNHHLSTLDIIFIKYINAFLPLLLIAICYVLIELHDRNYRTIRYIWHPFRRCLKRIYKDREPKKSIIDAFATFLLLSYNKILFVSFSAFAPTFLHNASGHTHRVVFYFDGSHEMFSGKYAVLSTIAVVIFAIFAVLPPAVLLLYPLSSFQKIIDRIPFRIVLRTFAESFNGDFKDGTFKDGARGSSDCRRYAGYYFLFRVVVLVIFVSQRTWLEQYYIQQILATVCVVLFAGVKPYKKNFYNKVDTAFFLLLSILNAFSFYNSQLFYNHGEVSQAVFWINYILLFLPLVYIICYAVYLILLWKGCLKRWTKLDSPVTDNTITISNDPSSFGDSETGDGYTYAYASKDSEGDVPDRLVNPQNYNSRNLYKPHDESAAALLFQDKQQRPRQGSSEKSYFYGKKDPHLVPYGSVRTSERHTEPIIRPSSRGRQSERSSGNPPSQKSGSVRFKGVV